MELKIQKDAGQGEDEYWVPYMEDFTVSICVIGKKAMKRIRKKCIQIGFHPTTHQKEEVVDDEKLDKLLTEHIIRGWKGLTMEVLTELTYIPDADKERMINEDLGGDPKKEIEFSVHNAQFLMDSSFKFSNFVNHYSMDASEIQKAIREKKEEEAKNS